MINFKATLWVLAILVIIHSGCVRSVEKKTDPSSQFPTELTDSDLFEYKYKIEYFSKVKKQIESEANEHDIITAYSVLMTDKYRQDLSQYRHLTPKANEHVIIKMLDFTIFSDIAVKIIPSIGSTNLMNLLVHYYYGSKYQEESSLSHATVKTIIAQLLMGPFSEPDQRLGMDKVAVESIRPKDTTGNNLVVYLRIVHLNKTFLCAFNFQKYVVNEKKMWLPSDWKWGGYIEPDPR